MTPDPRVEVLMKLADSYAIEMCWSGSHRYERDALESAIRTALTEARAQALRDAVAACNGRLYGGVTPDEKNVLQYNVAVFDCLHAIKELK